MGKVQGVSVVIGIPSFGMVSTYFLQARISQQFPLVSSSVDKVVLNKPIADARNEIVEFALAQNAQYIFWLDDDVIPPPNSFLRLYNQQKDIINGVYWSKSNPPMPLLFRGHLEGPYWDWHVGDLIEIDAAGSGLTLVKTDVYRKIQKELGGPWYSVDYGSFPGVKEGGPANTEDLYFYWKAKKAGYKVWADTSIQAYHYEKNSKILYGMPGNAPQAHPDWEIKPAGGKLIADLGAGGMVSPYMRDEGHIVTFDIREETNPSVVCDVRRIPVPDETFDIVYSSHTLEHFSFNDSQRLLKEWVRILKTGGELRIVVPNLKHAGMRIAKDEMLITDMWVLYGEQDYGKNFHATGFTPKMLLSLAQSLGNLVDIEISESDTFGEPNAHNWSLQLRAIKSFHPEMDNIAPDENEKSPDVPSWWPIAIYPDLNERPMTPESIEEDMAKALLNKVPRTFDFFGTPDDRIWKKEEKTVDTEKVNEEEKDGLDRGNEGTRNST